MPDWPTARARRRNLTRGAVQAAGTLALIDTAEEPYCAHSQEPSRRPIPRLHGRVVVGAWQDGKRTDLCP